MFWIILTSALALLGGLAGFTTGGAASALAFTIVGAFVALGARDLSKHRHAILAFTVVIFTIVLNFLWPGSGAHISAVRLPGANRRR